MLFFFQFGLHAFSRHVHFAKCMCNTYTIFITYQVLSTYNTIKCRMTIGMLWFANTRKFFHLEKFFVSAIKKMHRNKLLVSVLFTER